jgi:cytochrome P450
VSAISTGVIALIHYPAFLKKAQSQIDDVIGTTAPGTNELKRLPTFEDMEKLPYVTALALESLRWRDVAPLGIVSALPNVNSG